MKAVGLQSNIFYFGCVEDRDDPKKLGRVRVRVAGVHADNSSDVPTEDLPWASVLMPSNSPGTSGLGESPTGLVLGSWVMVIFVDGINCQHPMVIGSTIGFNPSTKTVIAPTVKEAAESVPDNKISAPKVVTTLGTISEKYEVGNRGPGYVSSGSGDAGGRSYGCYQLSSTRGAVAEFLKSSDFASTFAGMQINSNEFVGAWKKLGAESSEKFKEDQRHYIEKTYFVPCSNKLSFLDIRDRSDAISEMIFSYAVQYGPAGGASKIKRALNGKNVADLTDADIIELCYTDRLDNVTTDFKNSPSLHNGLRTRFKSEKSDVLALCSEKPSKDLKKADPLPKDSYGQSIESMATIKNTPTYMRKQGSGVFCDPTGKYPKVGYLGKVDTNRLARVEEISKTIHKVKKLSTINSNGFREKHTFDPKYPFNQVTETEAGHIIELDNTPNNERVHIFHKAGSFIEIHPDGTIVKKSVLDDQEIILANKSVYVIGDSNIFVEGNARIQSLGNISMEAEGNLSFRAQGNIDIECAGSLGIASVGSAEVISSSTLSLYGSTIQENPTQKSANVTVDVGAKIELKKILQDEEVPPTPDDWDADNDSSNQVFATKAELDEKAGFVSDSGPKTIEPQEEKIPVATVQQPDTSVVDKVESFKTSFKLSDNYTLGDLTTGVAAFKYKLQAQCGLSENDIVKNLMNVAANILEPILARYGRSGFIISNSFRQYKEGKSQHYFGMAVDLQFPGNSDRIPHIANEIKQLLPAFDQLIVEYHANNPVIHISYNKAKNRKMVFSTYSTNFTGLKPMGIYDKNQNMIYPS